MFKIHYLASSYYYVASFCDIFALGIYLNFMSNILAHYFVSVNTEVENVHQVPIATTRTVSLTPQLS